MKQQKLNAAQRKLAADWAATQERWNAMPKFARNTRPVAILHYVPPTTVKKSAPTNALTVSSRTTPGGSTALAPAKVYTGTAIIGIATMHKSNLIPIFNTEAAHDVAAMRR